MYINFLSHGSITPLQVAQRLQHAAGLVWLDSRQPQHPKGRFSFLGANPVEYIEHRASASAATWTEALEPLDRAITQRASSTQQAVRVPQWIGYIAFDAAVQPWSRHCLDNSPLLYFARYPAVWGFDHHTNQVFIAGDDEKACKTLARDTWQAPLLPCSSASLSSLQSPQAQSHTVAIKQALEHIRQGDIYQINLARCWQAELQGSPLTLWRRMRQASPVPLGVYLQHLSNQYCLMAATMESFLDWQRPTQQLSTSPIKGTLRNPEMLSHTRLAELFRQDIKEQAEHSMIVDLMRNDLGKVAQTGTVEVTQLMNTEGYAHLAHLVSTVSCRTPATLTLRELLAATFPPGSISGTPKHRALQLIDQLEPIRRGAYTGCVGMVDHNGSLDLAVTIRSAELNHSQLCFYAGGGIVADSHIEREVAETELKGRFFFEAIQHLNMDADEIHDRA